MLVDTAEMVEMVELRVAMELLESAVLAGEADRLLTITSLAAAAAVLVFMGPVQAVLVE